ncbi:LytR/AlgR family response regulator transcription factor [Ulvibacterium sp.]|uniref:LytR/AlgR family response regulator transcription factor n=1 Tax=Ulvibacterium sp. TaxID=2665914 RepID=UPI003BABB6BC
MSNKIKCIIVDDEPLARNVLVKYAEQIDQLEVVASCSNALEAFEHIQQGHIQLVFLDIKMPKLNGLELIESIKNPPLIVFTTAYRDFAVKAFELDAIDYLLKPISLTRFLKTISKVNKYLQGQHAELNGAESETAREEGTTTSEQDFLYIKADRKVVKLDLGCIHYLESLNDKVIIHLTDREVVTTQRISYLAEKLPKQHFIRIHRSYIISLTHITAYNNIMVEVKGRELPIGRNYRSQALEALRQ